MIRYRASVAGASPSRPAASRVSRYRPSSGRWPGRSVPESRSSGRKCGSGGGRGSPIRKDGIAPVRARISRRSAASALAAIQRARLRPSRGSATRPRAAARRRRVARGLQPEQRALRSRHREKRLDLSDEGRGGWRLAHDRESAVHRREPRAASVAQGGDESAVPAGCRAERPGGRPVPGAPGLDRPQELDIEGAAGTLIR